MAHLTRRLIISGRVQGVGFRWSLSTQAKALGLSGWVRNRRDGTVEALVYGTPEAVEAITVWAHQGPPHAHVERVISNDQPATEAGETLAGFEQRPTF